MAQIEKPNGAKRTRTADTPACHAGTLPAELWPLNPKVGLKRFFLRNYIPKSVIPIIL